MLLSIPFIMRTTAFQSCSQPSRRISRTCLLTRLPVVGMILQAVETIQAAETTQAAEMIRVAVTTQAVTIREPRQVRMDDEGGKPKGVSSPIENNDTGTIPKNRNKAKPKETS